MVIIKPKITNKNNKLKKNNWTKHLKLKIFKPIVYYFTITYFSFNREKHNVTLSRIFLFSKKIALLPRML